MFGFPSRRRAVLGWVAILVCGLAPLALAQSESAATEKLWRQIRPLIGASMFHFVEPKETLHDVAYENRLGFEAIKRLNPDVDPWLPAPGILIQLPTRMVLPVADETGLVINVPEMRLYDFTNPEAVRVIAVAVGDADDPTPVGKFRIGQKRVDPVWTVPRSIRTEKPYLPAQVPPGAENPLGSRWMTIGTGSYGIHGTNVKWSIGRGSTHGCVRLYEDVMEDLFDRTESGVPIQILYQPFKWGTNGKELFLEVHPDIYGRIPDAMAAALEVPRSLGLEPRLDYGKVFATVQRAEGIPVVVGTLP
jgi:L,D-transpeptidase ErfK/SrfK